MNKEEIFAYLNQNGIKYEFNTHEAVFNMDELKNVNLLYPELDGKNLFVVDDKKKQYYLITIKGDKRVDLKKFKNDFQTRSLSFASDEDLFNILNLKPHFVTPLGLLNDNELKAEFYLDKSFFNEPRIIDCHPNENTVTFWLKVDDLINLIKQHGNIIHFFEM